MYNSLLNPPEKNVCRERFEVCLWFQKTVREEICEHNGRGRSMQRNVGDEDGPNGNYG